MRQAVVVGAGIAGLATALRLSQSGWCVVVVERSLVRRSSGYVINLNGPGQDAADRLGILGALSAHNLGSFTSVVVAADGRSKFTVPTVLTEAALGDGAVSLFRSDLESTLYEAAARDSDIRFGTTVENIHQSESQVEVTLTDGRTERADLLVGADGLHSHVRRCVFGPEDDVRVDFQHMVAALPLDPVPTAIPERTGATFIGPGRTAAVMNMGAGRSSAFFTYRTPDPQTQLAQGPATALRSAFHDLGGTTPGVLDQIDRKPDRTYFDAVSQIKLDHWSRGRVVLVGDSAWCLTVFAGYGAALALHGATRLGDALDAHPDDIERALQAWETDLRPEAAKRQARARAGMSQFAPPTRAHVIVQNLAIRAMGLPLIRHALAHSIRRSRRGHQNALPRVSSH